MFGNRCLDIISYECYKQVIWLWEAIEMNMSQNTHGKWALTSRLHWGVSYWSKCHQIIISLSLEIVPYKGLCAVGHTSVWFRVLKLWVPGTHRLCKKWVPSKFLESLSDSVWFNVSKLWVPRPQQAWEYCILSDFIAYFHASHLLTINSYHLKIHTWRFSLVFFRVL